MKQKPEQEKYNPGLKSIYLKTDLVNRLKKLANERDRSFSNMVRVLLKERLNEMEKSNK